MKISLLLHAMAAGLILALALQPRLAAAAPLAHDPVFSAALMSPPPPAL